MPAPLSAPLKFAVVIPVYNHSKTIKAVVEKTMALNYPIWVVDDGSDQPVAPLVKDLKNVTVLCHRVNQGKGAALLTGFKAAANVADFAITIDADGQHDPADALNLIEALDTHTRPIVVGRRTRMDQPNTPWTSRYGREFSNFWIKMAGGPNINDTQSGFRIYPLPEVLDLDVAARRYQFELEILIKAALSRIPIVEKNVKVTYLPQGQRISHFHPFIDFLRNTGMFSRLIFHRVMQTIFGPVIIP